MNECHQECAWAAPTADRRGDRDGDTASAIRRVAVTAGSGNRERPTAISASTASTIPNTIPAWTRAVCDWPSLVSPGSEKATARAPAAGSPAATSVESDSIQAFDSTIQSPTTTTATRTPPREYVSPITTIQP